MVHSFESQRAAMVKHQIEYRNIHDKRLLDAFMKVPRHLFVPKEYELESYGDFPIPIGYHQTISQPYIVAYMIDYLDIKPTDNILEIGTGSGYQTAILAELCDMVYTVEIIEALQEKAKKLLSKLGYDNIVFGLHDGHKGWKSYAPFDKIIVSASANEIPKALLEQLNDQGLMILPIKMVFNQALFLIKKEGNEFHKRKLDLVRFVPLVKQ